MKNRGPIRILVGLGVLLATSGAFADSHRCTPSAITGAEAQELLRLLPSVANAIKVGATVSVLPYTPKDANPSFIYFWISTNDDRVHTVLDNGLIGYFSVDRRTARVVNVADEDVVGEARFAAEQRRIRSRHCITAALVARYGDESP